MKFIIVLDKDNCKTYNDIENISFELSNTGKIQYVYTDVDYLKITTNIIFNISQIVYLLINL